MRVTQPCRALPAPATARCLPQERGLKCACERCSEPIATSTDRFLEGLWCQGCGTEVLVAVPPGTPEADLAAAQYEEQVRAVQAARRGMGDASMAGGLGMGL